MTWCLSRRCDGSESPGSGKQKLAATGQGHCRGHQHHTTHPDVHRQSQEGRAQGTGLRSRQQEDSSRGKLVFRPPGVSVAPDTGEEGDSWAQAPTSLRQGHSWNPPGVHGGQGQHTNLCPGPSQAPGLGEEGAQPPPSRPGSVNHRAVSDSALAPQEARPMPIPGDGPGAQAVAGWRQEAPPRPGIRASSLTIPLRASPGAPRPPGPPRLLGRPSGPLH